MKLFSTISLEITAACNRRCKFCPVSYSPRKEERMKEELFVKAVTELGELEYSGRVEFYVYNEPAKDREYLKWAIEKTRETAKKSCLMIATNGDYFKSEKDLEELLDLGLNQLLINCYSAGLYDRRLKWLRNLPDEVTVGGNVYLVKSSTSKVVKMEDKSDSSSFGSGVFRLVNRAGNIPEFLPEVKSPVKRMCVKPFRILNINWKGEALVCCQDYYGHMSFANLRGSTLVEIWNHPVMNSYRRSLKDKNRELPLCRSCDCHAGAYSFNIPTPDGTFYSKDKIEEIWNQRVKKAENKSPPL